MPIQNETPGKLRIRRFRLLKLLSCLMAAWILAPVANAGGNPGAHEHGSARLQMAVENSRIDLIFTSAAYNLAGFEHEARTASERNMLTEITHWLETNPLINTAAGTCRVAGATVRSVGSMGANHHDNHSSNEHHHDDEATHRDYQVAQELECIGQASGEVFTTSLLSRFPELQELTIEWVSASGQGSTRITAANGTFTPWD